METLRKCSLLPHFVLALILALTAIAVFAGRGGRGEEPFVTATYSKGALAVTVPYHTPRAGRGRLVVEILDPEDRVLGRVERSVDVVRGDGWLRQEVKLGKPLPFDDVIWERLRYRFEYSGESGAAFEGIRAVSQILRRPLVRILGQNSYLAGAQAAVRVIVLDSQNQDPQNDAGKNPNAKSEDVAEGGSVRIELLATDTPPRLLFAGRLNKRGTTDAQFRFPGGLVGSYQLHYIAETSIGSAEYTQTIQLQDTASILLTTEKPIYQPGQSIHARALALDRAGYQAIADRKLTFVVEDSRGNKVFKKATQTDKFGIASADFALADEVNLGTYHLRALMGDVESPSNTAEVALNVERYILPKFKVAVDFTSKDNKPKRDYRPGDHVTGTVRANYFFGKPVDGSEVIVKASSMDVSLVEVGEVSGKTDKDGAYHYDLKLPDYFAGRPLSQGAARVLVEATVKDSAGHSETRGEPVTVSQYPLLITAVPEGGKLIPNLKNEVFLLTSYPDGTPAKTDISVRISGSRDQYLSTQRLSTDDGGVSVVKIKAGADEVSLQIDADDHRGATASAGISLPSLDSMGEDQVLLRTERAVYRAGEPIDLKVFSTLRRGPAYVDIVKDGQTILTRDLDIENGQAELSLTASPEMAGTLDFNAYIFGRDARPIGDHRLIFVQPADELKIETTADAQVYKPGDDARIRFRVTNSRGQGVSAAIGLQIVDEAVFALAEKQPGFAKVFFYLEQEAMKPRYEIHALSMNDVVEPVQHSQVEQRDRAARALFAATEMANPNRFQTQFGDTLPQEKYAEYISRYQAAFVAQIGEITGMLTTAYAQNPDGGDLLKIYSRVMNEQSSKPRDAWGTEYRLEPTGWSRGNTRYYRMVSAGADRQFDTADDLKVYVEIGSDHLANAFGVAGIDLRVEHDRSSVGQFGTVTGKVADISGAVIQGAAVRLRAVASGRVRSVTTDGSGQFSMSGVSGDSYHVEISAPGFVTEGLDFAVKPRDHAILSATLNVGSVSQTVEVASDARVLGEGGVQRPVAGAAMAGGFAGGVMGGILGGVGIASETVNVTSIGGPILQTENAELRNTINGRAVDQSLLKSRNVEPLVLPASVASPQSAEAPAPHVRSYFPEALYINPEIITDGNGTASITVPLADSITTWRMAMLASTQYGPLGSGTSSLKVFQDFFVDLDLPVTLTQGDRVSIPVGVYNYSGERGDVALKLQPEDWFFLDNDTADKSVEVDSGQVGGAQFTIDTRRIGKFKLTLTARMKGAANRADIVVREIEVVPNGREQNEVFNGHVDDSTQGVGAQQDLRFPPNAVPDASTIFVRLYPGPLSQVIEGMDSILTMPGGCFEQTSSSTYPNVLALDYMKRTKKLTPEIHAKAEGYIANGYQRLLTFEVPGGGFSWFGSAPANKILTAYGLMEFSDMAKVYDVDPRLIQRTQEWLAQQQQADGSWNPDSSFINEGATNRYNSDTLRITAYLGWGLENTGYRGPAVEKAKNFVESRLGSSKLDSYTLAVIANFAADYGADRDFTRRTMQMLLDARIEKDDQAWWSTDETPVYSIGPSASIETTGLAVQALLKWGQASSISRKALRYIAARKDASGAWGTTQATIMALRALLLASEKSSADVRGNLRVLLDGKPVETLPLTPENNDLLHQFVFKGIDAKVAHPVQLQFDGSGGLAYQVVGRYFVPWDQRSTEQKLANEALSIDVSYDRTRLAQSDIATATARVKSNLDKTANMVMVDLGIPPGFDLLSEDLQSFKEKTATAKTGRLEKFSLTATQAILYFNALAPGEPITLHFRLRAKYPIRAQTFQSRVYEYYDPEVSATARPVQLEVRAR
jgi:uncharacterized protein YfaS (alpha-2-macroglobulin family)